MFRLLAITLIALYGVFTVFGDDARRPEQVARQDTGLDSHFSFASFARIDTKTAALERKSSISDAQAIQLALEAGREHRANRDDAKPLRGLVAAIEAPAAETPAAATRDIRYVTGNRVNLRAGPGTGNSVVAQLAFGTEAEVLNDPESGWVEIRTATGDAGWIFRSFLDTENPA